LENEGRISVRLLGVTGDTNGIRVVRAGGGAWPPSTEVRPLRGAVLHPGDAQPVTLLLALRGCGTAQRLDTLDRVTVRYRLAGATFTQPIMLAIRPTISCPWRA
jgi:hypothetical protein